MCMCVCVRVLTSLVGCSGCCRPTSASVRSVNGRRTLRGNGRPHESVKPRLRWSDSVLCSRPSSGLSRVRSTCCRCTALRGQRARVAVTCRRRLLWMVLTLLLQWLKSQRQRQRQRRHQHPHQHQRRPHNRNPPRRRGHNNRISSSSRGPPPAPSVRSWCARLRWAANGVCAVLLRKCRWRPGCRQRVAMVVCPPPLLLCSRPPEGLTPN